MDKIKIIKTEEDYQAALKMIESLMAKDPDPESEAGERLSVLAFLVRDYESKLFPETLPDPIDAILFRMEQQGMKPGALIPFIGSRSKVSEVLSRKRPLTLSMIRSLEANLGIPARVLVKEVDEFRNPDDIAWNQFPIKEMASRGYFGKPSPKAADVAALMKGFFGPVGSPGVLFGMLRKSTYRSARPMDKHALAAWSACVVKRARAEKDIQAFRRGTVTPAFMRTLAQLSANENGPLLAIEALKKHGIALMIEPPFPRTYLDGATLVFDRHPVVGLTLRHDRLDNFWFTLMHEVAHVALHFDGGANLFYDDLDNPDPNDHREAEADHLAGEVLVPAAKWDNSPARLIPSAIAAESLARDLGVHIAVVAGKMRYEGGSYQYLNSIISQSKVRKYFPEHKWAK